ncbi:MAG: ATP-binding protein, partial [Actinobacteria bacterium]|nr:ATP-binding protein [Actinomycetota bacterium]NIT95955.1 ATP-binding protein [Actinomycetota bacterium]NIX50939.1 drug:proton antiporter [Actinomycetota bacterium]
MAEVEVTPQVLSVLHAALTGPESGTTVAVREGGTVAGVWNGYVDRITGVAIDIGSTTIAGYLCDLASGELLATAGVMNPQIRFGEDLMSRVSYAMMHDEGAAPLT